MMPRTHGGCWWMHDLGWSDFLWPPDLYRPFSSCFPVQIHEANSKSFQAVPMSHFNASRAGVDSEGNKRELAELTCRLLYYCMASCFPVEETSRGANKGTKNGISSVTRVLLDCFLSHKPPEILTDSDHSHVAPFFEFLTRSSRACAFNTRRAFLFPFSVVELNDTNVNRKRMKNTQPQWR